MMCIYWRLANRLFIGDDLCTMEMMGRDELKALVTAARCGDIEAFEKLYHRYYQRIYNLLLQMVGDPDDAADLTQDVFLSAFRNIRKLSASEAFQSWLMRIAMNAVRDFLRRRKVITFESLDKPLKGDEEEEEVMRELPSEELSPEDEVAKQEINELIHRAVDQLPYHHREVIVLHYFHEMEVEEIARIL
ncbi:MAG TPA: sigma-70 family RNA polymerase sigma factor, partial [Armatimonadetes bacterium]|nr:sigma-70 family RNA polymerase sigma factor [Armatimonadota bacterium]